jgi:hypothetical protein
VRVADEPTFICWASRYTSLPSSLYSIALEHMSSTSSMNCSQVSYFRPIILSCATVSRKIRSCSEGTLDSPRSLRARWAA